MGIKITILVLLFLSVSTNIFSQIEDIKDKSKENKSNSSSNYSSNSSSDDDDSDIGGEIVEGCLGSLFEGCFDACIDAGCSMIMGFIGEYTSELADTKDEDPSIISLDLNGNFALAYHYSMGDYYKYVNYLPGLRANLAAFTIDYRYNILTEYSNDFPNSFKSWHLDLAFNIIPDKSFKLGLGMGVHREITGDSYFHEYLLFSKIMLNPNTDYIEYDLRTSYDYDTEAFPFFETGLRYNKRFFDSEHLSGYISLGGMYQNYYTSHDIWALRGGIIFNWH